MLRVTSARDFVCLGSREAREKWHVSDAPEGRETAVAAAGFLARFVCHFIHDSADHVPSIYPVPLAPRPLPLSSPSRVGPWYEVAGRSFRTLFR